MLYRGSRVITGSLRYLVCHVIHLMRVHTKFDENWTSLLQMRDRSGSGVIFLKSDPVAKLPGSHFQGGHFYCFAGLYTCMFLVVNRHIQRYFSYIVTAHI